MTLLSIARLCISRQAPPIPVSDSATDRETEVVDDVERHERKLDRERQIRREQRRLYADPRHRKPPMDRRATMPNNCGGRKFDRTRLAYLAEVNRRHR